MKKILTLLVAGAITLGSFAQTTVEVVTGTGYANEAYYSFTGGTVSTSARTDWDISFPTDRYGINILANNGAGVELYTYPDGDISAWATVDTTGIASWPQMYNSIAYWSDGAFMQYQDTSDQFDYGWGRYSMVNHHIVGDSLYVIKTTAGNYKKLWIIDKDPNSGANTWELKYANIDGTDEHTDTLQADPYTAKNHISYSLETNQIIENEPASDQWELLFTKYYDYNIPYYVTGILSNSARVAVQEVDGVTSATYEAYSDSLLRDTISIIGSDWKTFDMGSMSYVLDSNRVFFAKVFNETGTDSTYWKMYFTAFTGMSEGKYTFVQKQLIPTSSIGVPKEVSMLDVYPNPATDHINVLFDIQADAKISIFDMSGRMVYNQQLNTNGFNQHTISINQLQNGIHTIIIETEHIVSRCKFIKQ
jgi:hypothetical protein